MKIGILMLRHSQGHEGPVMTGVIRLLSDLGVQIDVIYPEELVIDLRILGFYPAARMPQSTKS